MNDEGIRRAERVDKPWGYELIWAHTDRYIGKILHVVAGESLSLQYHRQKDETLYVLSGSLELTLGERADALTTQVLGPGDRVRVRPGWVHRLAARSDCDVLEVSTAEIEDVVRLADRYGRADG